MYFLSACGVLVIFISYPSSRREIKCVLLLNLFDISGTIIVTQLADTNNDEQFKNVISMQ